MIQFILHHWRLFTALATLLWPTLAAGYTFIVSFFRITFLSLALFEYYRLARECQLGLNTVCSNTSTERGHQEGGADVRAGGLGLLPPPGTCGGVENSNFPMFCCLGLLTHSDCAVCLSDSGTAGCWAPLVSLVQARLGRARTLTPRTARTQHSPARARLSQRVVSGTAAPPVTRCRITQRPQLALQGSPPTSLNRLASV